MMFADKLHRCFLAVTIIGVAVMYQSSKRLKMNFAL